MATEPKTNKKSPTKVMFCGCSHEYQDQKYGKSMRVHNPCKESSGGKCEYRCTVCGQQK